MSHSGIGKLRLQKVTPPGPYPPAPPPVNSPRKEHSMGYRPSPPPPPAFPANTPMATFGPSDFLASIAEWVQSWFAPAAPRPALWARFDDGYVPDRPWMEGRDS